MIRTDVAAVGEIQYLVMVLRIKYVGGGCVCDERHFIVDPKRAYFAVGSGVNYGPKDGTLASADSWIAREPTVCVSVLLFCTLTLPQLSSG
jgi:hypothetical protein